MELGYLYNPWLLKLRGLLANRDSLKSSPLTGTLNIRGRNTKRLDSKRTHENPRAEHIDSLLYKPTH